MEFLGSPYRYIYRHLSFFAALHTWGQNLLHHLHMHCVFPCGGLSADDSCWISCKPGFFLPVRVLSRLFRRLFPTYLQQAFDAGGLCLAGSLESLSNPAAWDSYLGPVRDVEWVVYAKPPFAGPAQVLEYVGRY